MVLDDKELAQGLYERILRTANTFLTDAKRFEISVLQDHDPSYEELARIMGTLAETVSQFINEIDPMMAHKANEYVYIMREMALAINA